MSVLTGGKRVLRFASVESECLWVLGGRSTELDGQLLTATSLPRVIGWESSAGPPSCLLNRSPSWGGCHKPIPWEKVTFHLRGL